MTLYSKDGAVSLIRSAIRRDRLSHAYLLCGERGVGKRTAGKFMAAQILCECGSGDPCGICKSCRMISNSAHPDFIAVEPSGKSGNYLADDLRPIVSDASVSPNEGERKIYFLPNIDRALPAAQNVLLKIVEEPPAHVVFIMTAESREKILPTILSRTVSINIGEASKSEAVSALKESGISQSDAENAVGLFGGNIGKCLEYAQNSDDARRLADSVRAASSAIAAGDEYALLKELSSLEKDRELLANVLDGLRDVIRDAAAIKLGTGVSSLAKDSAEAISKKYRQSGLIRISDAIFTAGTRISQNASAPLCISDLCGRIFGG